MIVKCWQSDKRLSAWESWIAVDWNIAPNLCRFEIGAPPPFYSGATIAPVVQLITTARNMGQSPKDCPARKGNGSPFASSRQLSICVGRIADYVLSLGKLIR